MQETVERIIEGIQTRAKSEEFRNKHRRESKDFTRKRSWRIEQVVYFVIGCVKNGLALGLERFAKDAGMPLTSAAAITKARRKLKYTAFRALLTEMNEQLPCQQSWKGWRVLAIDGTKGELACTEELMKKSGSEGRHYPQFHAVAVYDALNGYFLDSTFAVGTVNEREAALELFASIPERGILTLDRGFPSGKMLYELNKQGKHYVMRAQGSGFSEVKDFMRCMETDKMLEIKIDKIRGHQMKMPEEVEYPLNLKIRVVKIPLNSGETEVLLTNLTQCEATVDELSELYRLRWGIEISFGWAKNAVLIEEFLGETENNIRQEFYASLLVYNLTRLTASAAANRECAQPPIPQAEKKLEYQINFMKAAVLMKSLLAQLLTTTLARLPALLSDLITQISTHKSAVRPDRSFPRERSNCRHPIQYRRSRCC
jgi:hypothetical protein